MSEDAVPRHLLKMWMLLRSWKKQSASGWLQRVCHLGGIRLLFCLDPLVCWWYMVHAEIRHAENNSQLTKTNQVALNHIAHHINIELAHSATALPCAVAPQDSATRNVANDQQPALITDVESDAMADRV
jgi:hypothetical protein